MQRLLWFVLAWLIPAYSLAAVSAAQPSVPKQFQEPFSAQALTQLLVGLLVVVFLIFFLSWLLKRFSGVMPVSRNMRVLGVLPLSTREKAVLVQVGDTQMLLGVAPGRVTTLHTFEQPVCDINAQPEGFAAKLAEALNKRKGAKAGDTND